MSPVGILSKATQILNLKPISATFGAEVTGMDLTTSLDEGVAAELREALWTYKVLVFRDQEISDDDQIRLTRYFGDVTPAHPITNGLREKPEIKVIQMDDTRKRPDDVFDVSNPLGNPSRPQSNKGWHIDVTFVANPTSVTVLRSVDVPAVGGDTLYADAEALYASFSSKFQAYIDSLQVVHARDDEAKWGRPPVPRFDGRPPGPFAALHPLVRVHPVTGKKVLFHAPEFAKAVADLRRRESNDLLEYLDEEVDTRYDAHLRVQWDKNCVVVWDNMSTIHNGPIGLKYFTGARVHHRTTARGDLTRGPDGFVSRPLAGALFSL